ncbi:helix-turn-helix domain-containing protein [Levilactobacillus yiduensis]|uniref:helix-turn-helix domain-containing protein n=1 Tax=Levilactobacillus yiduensis TaxID=2953880 RepID=UPI000EF29EF2|nr:helix-turn-helix domain-containing protein [Levilactobacillus yiduensis]AYM02394.1 helix-turn-helix domain-containing protein [Levilactobacillus brevis]
MPTYSPSQEDYRKLAHSLAKFTSLTQINTIFFDFTGILLKDDFVYVNQSVIEDNLAHQGFDEYALLPVSRNIQLWGAIMCDSSTVSKKRLFLSRAYLEDAMRQIFTEKALGRISVWEPLTSDQASQIGALNAFITMGKNSTNELSKFANSTISTTAKEHPIDNDEVFHSVTSAIDYIRKNIQHPISLNEVAQHAFLSPSYLSRLFKKYLHVNFVEYVNNQKIALAQEKLLLTLTPISQISTQIGFAQTSYFTKIFKKKTGMTPSEYRQRNHTIKKIYTIPRDLNWNEQGSIIDASKNYFENNHIGWKTESSEGAIYVNSIGELNDAGGDRGWIYTVDGQQPTQPADEISVENKSVIQWVYTGNDN